MAYDAKTSRHFAYFKTLSILNNFHWKHKSRDFKRYIQGCTMCQHKNYIGKKQTDPAPLEVPERCWGSPDAILLSSSPKRRMDSTWTTTYVDRVFTRAHFIPPRKFDTAVDVVNDLFSNQFNNDCSTDSLVLDRDPKFTYKFGKGSWVDKNLRYKKPA